MWDGARWRTAKKHDLERLVKEVQNDWLVEGRYGEDLQRRRAMLDFARRSCGLMRMRAVVEMARSERILWTHSSAFDQNPNLLSVANGTVDLSTGQVFVHDPDDYITKLTRIRFDAAAKAPRWQQFLNEVFAGDAELIEYVQRAVGYTLTGHTREHKFFVLYGGGQNGKGRFIRQLMRLLGDAAQTTSFTTFTADRAKQSGNTPELAALAGARLVVAGEPDEGVRLSESTIKSLTGEDEIMACAKYERPFSYAPCFKIWLHTNHRPRIHGTDDGIWRRPQLIPFDVSFAGRADLQLDEKLDAEGPGMLNWAVDGARKWHEHGLGTAARVEAAAKSYREESDRIGVFLTECATSDEGAFLSNHALYDAYTAWCTRNGEDAVTPQTLSKALMARGHSPYRKSNTRGWVGLELVGDGVTARDT